MDGVKERADRQIAASHKASTHICNGLAKGEIKKLVQYRQSLGLVFDDEELKAFALAYMSCSLDDRNHIKSCIRFFAQCLQIDCDETTDFIQNACRELQGRNFRFDAKQMGHILQLTHDERQRLDIRTIRAFDVSEEEMGEIRKQKKAEQNKNRNRSQMSREEYEASAKTRAEFCRAQPISESTFYRWKRAGKITLSLDGQRILTPND